MVRVIGLMSGSSLDGLDIACVDFSFEDRWKFDIVAAETIEYSAEWKEKLVKSTELDARSYVLLDADYGHHIGRCINEFLERFDLSSTSIDLVASHGHTVFHEPWNGMTAQIGDGAAIAAETGLKVVSNLRSIDVALAGQGAPIVPMGEKHLFKNYRLLLNIGGIANLTDQEFAIAFDICPANRILNKLMSQYLHEEFDRDGQISSTGHIDSDLLEKLNQFDYYSKSYPKSLSNSFGLNKILPVLTTFKIPVADLLRTYVEHIVEQIVRALEMIIEKEKKGRSIYENCHLLVTGGGGHNQFLIERLGIELKSKFSIDIECPEKKVVDFKEALIMAFLGLLRFENRCNVLSSVTGAQRDSIGGALWAN